MPSIISVFGDWGFLSMWWDNLVGWFFWGVLDEDEEQPHTHTHRKIFECCGGFGVDFGWFLGWLIGRFRQDKRENTERKTKIHINGDGKYKL